MQLLPKYFDVVSLQQLLESAGSKSTRPRCAITFDDGWHDFYTNAYPIIQEKKIPATVFLPTNYMGTKQWFWTDRLATILKKSVNIPVQSSSDTLAPKIRQLSGTLFSRIDRAIKLLKPLSQDQIIKVLVELESKDNDTPHKQAFLDWYNCRTLKNSGLVSFGSHTANHIILTAENEQKCKDELELSKKRLLDEEVVDTEFIPFCYPNGGFSEKCAFMVQEAGYHCAVTTKKGWVDGNSNRFMLKRVGIHEDMVSKKALMMARICE
jgi:peptidoglycan/xylan/chitin deacetylase (PgdA/CDA1 family)